MGSPGGGGAHPPRRRPPQEGPLIRPATPEDSAAVTDLAVAAGMFSTDDAWFLEGMMADYFGGNQNDGHVCVVDDEGGPIGVAYYQPETAADRVWDLTMIAVRPARQGRGRGTALLRHVEDDLRTRDQRLLLVETSSLPKYDARGRSTSSAATRRRRASATIGSRATT